MDALAGYGRSRRTCGARGVGCESAVELDVEGYDFADDVAGGRAEQCDSGGGAGESVGVQAAAEAVKFAFERGGIEAQATLEAEDLKIVRRWGWLYFAAMRTEKCRGGERGVAGPAGERVVHGQVRV